MKVDESGSECDAESWIGRMKDNIGIEVVSSYIYVCVPENSTIKVRDVK